jgi:hypothetical protein
MASSSKLFVVNLKQNTAYCGPWWNAFVAAKPAQVTMSIHSHVRKYLRPPLVFNFSPLYKVWIYFVSQLRFEVRADFFQVSYELRIQLNAFHIVLPNDIEVKNNHSKPSHLILEPDSINNKDCMCRQGNIYKASDVGESNTSQFLRITSSFALWTQLPTAPLPKLTVLSTILTAHFV